MLITAQGRAQLQAYPNAAWANETVVAASSDGDQFRVTFADGGMALTHRLVLATGVTDELPPIDGLAQRWGKSVFHCPYCHGYELDQGDIGVLATSEMSMHHALLLPDWGRVTFFLNQAFTPNAAQYAALARRGVTTEATPIARIDGAADVVLEDGRRLPMAGLFVMSRTGGTSTLAAQLGCAMEAGPMGDFVQTDAQKATNVPGVFAAEIWHGRPAAWRSPLPMVRWQASRRIDR